MYVYTVCLYERNVCTVRYVCMYICDVCMYVGLLCMYARLLCMYVSMGGMSCVYVCMVDVIMYVFRLCIRFEVIFLSLCFCM